MIAKRIKQILLGVLLVIAGYIWWGNLALLFPTAAVHEAQAPSDQVQGSAAHAVHGMVYREPKTNPFLHAVAVPPDSRSDRAAVPAGPAPLPGTLQLVGVLCLGTSSQAVLQVDPQTTKTYALGERLGEWTLIEVTDETAVFVAGKARDTLRLVGTAPADRR